jgi:hypothetical protein
MSYFTNFPEVQYIFGDHTSPVSFQNINIYSDVIDNLKDNVSSYSYYNILDGDRPDVVAAKLYDDPSYHWTILLMNDHIRESGWPLTRQELDAYVQENYTGCSIVTTDDFWGSIIEGTNVAGPALKVGDVVTGSISGTSGTVTRLDPDNGQFFLDIENAYSVGEEVTWRDEENALQSLTITSCMSHPNAIDHFEDADGNHVDIDPTSGPGVLLLEVTIKDMVMRRNEELREIRVIDPAVIDQVVDTIKQSIRS